MQLSVRPSRRPFRNAFAAFLTALVLVTSSVITTAAEGPDVFTATWISDSAAVATINLPGGETSVTMRLTNATDSSDVLQSANITAPAGYTLTDGSVDAEGASASVEGGVLQLRGLAIAQDSSLDVTIDVTTPCLPDEVAAFWTVVAKPTSDFGGEAEFALADGSVAPSTTRNAASCRLRFTHEPNTTKTNNIIKSGFNSTGDLVTVEIYDPVTSDVVTTDATVTLIASTNPAGGTLSGGAEGASEGTATFPTLKLDKAGSYKLQASSAVAVNTPITGRFMVSDTVSTCSGSGCKFTETRNGNSYTTTPQKGTAGAQWATSLNLSGVKISCAFAPFNYPANRQPNAVWYTYDDGTTASAKTNVIVIDSKIVKETSDNGASKYRVCYSSPVQFKDRTGNLAQPDPWSDGPSAFFGVTWYTGLLPDCAKKNPVAPCVLSWIGSGGGNRTGTFLTPPGDPSYR